MDISTLIIYFSIYIGLVSTTFFILSYIADGKKEKKLFSDKELPGVSILIPAYNEEKSIVETIESIANSDYPKGKMEIIVIDDGSKDKTYSLAKKYEGTFNGKTIRVLTKKNGGKGTALNLGISRAKFEFIFSMDADTFVEPDSVKKMVRPFKDKDIMSVTSAMIIHKPKTILQKIQQVEYVFGLFLRKAFASINSLYITPGAFSAYRKSFFEKYGGYAENDLTEDLEVAMRIQYYGYKIENSMDAFVYTISPSKFIQLTKQRRRWYAGTLKNTWRYKKIFGKKYGDLGMFVFPIAWVSVFISIYGLLYFLKTSINSVYREILFLNAIDYNFISYLTITSDFFHSFFYLVFSNTKFMFLMLFSIALIMYLHFTKKRAKVNIKYGLGTFFYIVIFSLLFGFWWAISMIYALTGRRIKWR